MIKFFKNYSTTFILIAAVIIGGIIGIIFGEKSSVLKPFGELYLNLLFMIIVPLIFFSISSAISNMKQPKRLGKIMITIFAVFMITSLIASILGLAGTSFVKPFKNVDKTAIQSMMTKESTESNPEVKISEQLVNTFTVSDFSLLLTKKNMLALIVFSVLFGLGIATSKEKGEKMAEFVHSGTNVIMKMISIIMYYAPVGIGCYFAAMIGELGPQILEGYATAFVLYLVIALIYYFGFYTLYAYVGAGKDGIKVFWKNVIAPSATALATCSSAASMPTNLEAVKKIGVPNDVAETTVPLGAAIHKDGSVIGGVFKIMFLFALFGTDINSLLTISSIIGVSFLVGAVMVAIPGVSLIAEMLILTVFGFPLEALPIVAVISAIIDAPATLLNTTGNTACSMLVARFTDGKNWLKKNK